MPKATAMITPFVVALALSAAATTPASAAWYVSGSRLATGSKVALSTKAVIDEPATVYFPTLSLKITCSGLSTVKPEVVGTTKGQAEHLDFEACSEIEPKTCKLDTSNIKTEPIAWSVHESARENRIEVWLMQALTGALLTTLVFEGSCSLAGEKPINGSVTLAAPTMRSEEVSQIIEGIGSLENHSLEVAKNRGYIEKGKVLLKLASGSKWSFR